MTVLKPVVCAVLVCAVLVWHLYGTCWPLCMVVTVCSHRCAQWLRVGTSMQLSSVGEFPSGVALGEVCLCQDEGVMFVVLVVGGACIGWRSFPLAFCLCCNGHRCTSGPGCYCNGLSDHFLQGCAALL